MEKNKLPPIIDSPGPPCHWLLGCLPDYGRDPMAYFTDTARTYGDFVRLRFARLRAVLISRPEIIEQVLMTREGFIKGRALRNLKMTFGDGLLTSEGESWKKRRISDAAIFRKKNFPAYMRDVAVNTARRMEKWECGKTHNLHSEAKMISLTNTAITIFQSKFTEETFRVIDALESMMLFYSKRQSLSGLLPRNFPTSQNRLYRAQTKQFVALADELLKGKDGEGQGSEDNLLANLRREIASGEIGHTQALDEIRTLLLTGYDTPSLALTWSWYLLAKHPEIQEKLRQEVFAVLGDRLPTFEDLPSLKRAESVIWEAMRLYPPVWVMAREATRDCELAGHRVASGTQVLMCQWSMHRDPRFFKDPDEFLPERWENEAIKQLPRFAYFPFGGGSRMCVARSFALAETTLALVIMMQKFRLHLQPGYEPELWPSITLRPANGLPMRLERI